MMEISFQPDRESLRTLSRLERDTPRLFRRAYFDGVTRVRSAFRAIMRKAGGRDGVPSFVPRHWMTLQIHPGTRPGGVLAEKNRIVMYSLGGDARFVGWVGTLHKWAEKYQTAETYTWTTLQRAMWHRMRIHDIPANYDRPARPVVEPLHTYLAANFARYVLESYNKRARSLQAKGMELL